MHRSNRYRDAPPGVGEGVPLHLWVVGVLSLAWNAFGAFDYTMTNMRNPAYLANFPPDMLPMIAAMPLWARLAWAVGVWAALAGSILLLLRWNWAFVAFALSLGGLAVSTIWQWLTELPTSMQTPEMMGMNVAICVIATALAVYARRMAERGVLR